MATKSPCPWLRLCPTSVVSPSSSRMNGTANPWDLTKGWRVLWSRTTNAAVATSATSSASRFVIQSRLRTPYPHAPRDREVSTHASGSTCPTRSLPSVFPRTPHREYWTCDEPGTIRSSGRCRGVHWQSHSVCRRLAYGCLRDTRKSDGTTESGAPCDVQLCRLPATCHPD